MNEQAALYLKLLGCNDFEVWLCTDIKSDRLCNLIRRLNKNNGLRGKPNKRKPYVRKIRLCARCRVVIPYKKILCPKCLMPYYF